MTTPAEPRRYRPYIVGGIVLAVALAVIAVTVSLLPAGPAAQPSASPSNDPAASGSSASPSPSLSERGETPPGPATRALPPGEPAPPPPPLVKPPASQTESEVGELVAGFPENIPLVPESTISTSSLDSDGTRVQASVVASTPASAADVTTYYENLFAALGFPGSPLPAASGSSAVSFARGGESVTLTVTPSPDGSRYSLFGVLGAGS
ncbi:hypothetical protein [Conyzicola sp.]|uniref:hypothetical protein n=1 Tax=Conyzicola sp. TaxID=1969404 RepID=UPI003988A74C